MANLEVFAPGHGVAIAGSSFLTSDSRFSAGSETWLPGFVTTQTLWATGATDAVASDLQCGSQVYVAATATYVVTTKGGSTSTVAPNTGTTTPGIFTGVLADGYQWLCIGNATADFTSLASGYQAVSQITIDNRASILAGDTMMEISVSLASGSSGAAGAYVTVGVEWLNQDGSTYGDGLGGGSNQSAPQISQGNILYSAGKSSPIVGSIIVPLRTAKGRLFLINNTGNALSSSTHVVAFRTGVFGLNG